LTAVFGALALGIAVGLDGQDFVSEDMDDWFGTAKETTTDE
jgi:hypothetical protein